MDYESESQVGYKSESIATILKGINTTFFLPSLQRDFVWDSEQICELFDSLMRKYPISSFLFWKVPDEVRNNIEGYPVGHTSYCRCR